MFFLKSREKELKMIWEVHKDNKRSYLVGTAHFFPFSFKTALRRYLKKARTAIFEGPLDDENMSKVVAAGCDSQNSYHLFDELDKRAIDDITDALRPACRDPNSFFIMDLCKLRMENPVYEMIKGSSYLKKNGWTYSVDMEGYNLAKAMGKKIAFLETIDEQINVLKNLSRERILEFLHNVDRWPTVAQAYVDSYLDGDLEKLRSKGLRFPSRHHSVIDHRDEIFYERLQDYLEEGDFVAFVGAPHVRGLSRLLHENGYQISGPVVD
jgi:uncharacterized protein YbaP (TraB family)